jgi:hypothetical protein
VCSGVLSNPHHPLLHSHITSSLTVPHTISDYTTPANYYMEFIQMFNSKYHIKAAFRIGAQKQHRLKNKK